MFGGGGGGMNPRKMKQMMEQMGIDLTEIDAEEVVIRTADEELVFDEADVQRMDAQGQSTYQIVGDPSSRPRSDGSGAATPVGTADDDGDGDGDGTGTETGTEGGEASIPDADVEIVAQRTGASESEAREALEAEDGDLAAAVSRLE